jgi:tetratricopeptide (TPR) repeat protein
MTSIAKLKDRARKHEQREDWRSAIEVYRKVLDAEEAEHEIELELGLFNRVGDLYLRLGQTDEAVGYYERAADKYADSGFYNNAIALCNKALRHRPDRPEIYLKLSGFCQQQGFLTDARRWILGYAERQVKRGQVEAALKGLRSFVQAANAPDVRELLAQHLATHDHVDEAIGQLRQAYAEWSRRGDEDAADRVAEQARALDPDLDLAAAAAAPVHDTGDLPGLDPADSGASRERPADEEPTAPRSHAGLQGLETHRADGLSAQEADRTVDRVHDPGPPGHRPEAGTAAGVDDDDDRDALGGLETFGPREAAAPPGEEVERPDADEGEDPWVGAGVDPAPGASELPELDEDQPEPLPLLDTGFEQEGGSYADPAPLLDRETPEETEDESVEAPESLEGAGAVPAEASETLEAPEHEHTEAPEWDEWAGGVADPGEAARSTEIAGPPEAETETEAEAEVRAEAEPAARAWAEPEVEPEVEATEATEATEAVEPTGLAEGVEERAAAQADAAAEREDAAEPEDARPIDELEPLEGLDLGAGFEVGSVVDFGGEWDGDESEEEPLVLDLGGPKIHSEDAQVDVEVVLARAKELVSRGLVMEASSELRLLSPADTPPDKLREALTVTNELVRRNPNDLAVLQRRVEFASRIGDRLLLVDTYLDLADALARSGSETKAQVMYQRVLGLDPENSAAREALGDAAVAEAAPVDLEAILREMGGGTAPPRQAVKAEEGDERDDGFAAMLSQFKARPDDAAAAEDSGAHYDLGLAFKEMGLIDEAIGEFQTALRAGEERLKVYEELGQCFMLNGQYTVAVKILRRALQAPRQSDTDLLGVFYQLGQCHEELGQRNEAREAYEKVLAIDPEFGDVIARVARL